MFAIFSFQEKFSFFRNAVFISLSAVAPRLLT